jgi:caffeoyl-CoA O-methyltransferase
MQMRTVHGAGAWRKWGSWLIAIAGVAGGLLVATTHFGQPPGPPGGGRRPGLAGPPTPQAQSYYDNPVMAKDEEEKRILNVLEELGGLRRYQIVSPADGRLLRLLTEAIGAKRVVEIGTSIGYSGIWFCLALRKTGGHLYTHEINPERIQLAKANFEKAGVSHLVTIIEGDAHETVLQHKEPIDILFLDADKEGYIDYLQKLLPLVRSGGLIIAHNVRSPGPDPRFIEAITQNPELETAFLLMEGAGVSVTLKKR